MAKFISQVIRFFSSDSFCFGIEESGRYTYSDNDSYLMLSSQNQKKNEKKFTFMMEKQSERKNERKKVKQN